MRPTDTCALCGKQLWPHEFVTCARCVDLLDDWDDEDWSPPYTPPNFRRVVDVQPTEGIL